MNIFWISFLIKSCSEEHFDRHVVKMILEYAQLLCSAHWMLEPVGTERLKQTFEALKFDDKRERNFYKLTHKNHPCSIWVRQHVNNYRWLASLAVALCKEYSHRYKNRVHKTEELIKFLQKNEPLFPTVQKSNNVTKKNLTNSLNNNRVSKNTNDDGQYDDSHKAMLKTFRIVSFEIRGDPKSMKLDVCQVTDPAQAMPEEYRYPGNPLYAYRKYYRSVMKGHLRKWTLRSPPSWFSDTTLLPKPLEIPKKKTTLTTKSSATIKNSKKRKISNFKLENAKKLKMNFV